MQQSSHSVNKGTVNKGTAMRFNRAIALARYNWPLYLVCCGSAIIGFAVAMLTELPFPLRVAAFLGALVAAWYACASFLAFHWMFDRSELLSGQWLRRYAPEAPESCVQISVCVEETTLPIESVFPNARCTNLDLFDDSVMTEPAIGRAKRAADTSVSNPATPDSLPLDDSSSELTVVTLAAHEVRDRNLRKKLFEELARVTAANGRIIIAEHLRNVPAALAFGPGMFHFYPRSEWTALAKSAGLRIKSECDITPFVHIFVLQNMRDATLKVDSSA